LHKPSLIVVLFICLAFQVSAQNRIDSILVDMSLEQKVAQMFVFTFFGTPANQYALDVLSDWQPGAVALLPSNLGDPVSVTNLTNSLQQTVTQAGGVPLFIAVDQEGGVVAHLKDGFTEFPVPMLLTATGNTELAYQVAQAKASEMRAVGINMNFAPVADLHTNPDNPIIGRRSFGSNPQMVAPILSAFISGLQDGDVLATAKHFPGHGDTASDSHLTLPVIDYDLDRLEDVELVPFRAAIDSGVGAIMAAHIWFPQLESQENLPASLSQSIISGLLRDSMQYDGLIITDAMDMDAIDTRFTPEERAFRAVEAGHDLILVGAHVSPENQIAAMQAVVNAVDDGMIDESRIDASVQRILAAKAEFGVLDWQPLDAQSAAARIDVEANDKLIESVFRAGITVVRDQQPALLLQGDVAFLYPDSRFSLWRACRDYSDQLLSLGISQTPTTEQISSAQRTATLADTVVVFTINADTNSAQTELIQSLPPEKTFVVALWSPYDLLAFPEVAGYMVTYSPLLQSNAPICEILFGDYDALGQLAVNIGEIRAGD